MQPNEFFYWLQGYFELSPDSIPLTKAQAERIIAHTRLVSQPGEAIIAVRHMCALITGGIRDAVTTDTIRSTVADVFEHVIDPQAGGPKTQDHLNGLHGGGGLMRC